MWIAGKHAINDRRLPLVMVGALIILAWMALLTGGSTVGDRFAGAHLHHPAAGGVLSLAFLVGWVVMTVAMMLPTSLPLVVLFQRLTERRTDHVLLVILLVGGYLGVWTLFGILVNFGDWALHRLVAGNGWLLANAWAIGPVLLVMAGLYQFTPLKYHCLDRCRSPLGFVMQHWRGRGERMHALRLGVHHGLFCLGCCWSLMLLMFAVGAGNIIWMLALGAVMAVEKNVPRGRRLSAPLGVLLLGMALAMLISAWPG